MKAISLISVCLVLNVLPLAAQNRQLSDRSQRGTLDGRVEPIRGDSGKWRDEAGLCAAPAPPDKMSLDNWADAIAAKPASLSAAKDTWLIYRSEQLDDNDRLWIESITREGDRIRIVLRRCTWKGYYQKNFTWYGSWGVNLGKLPAGNYRAEWVVQPWQFRQFEDPKKIQESRPKDEEPTPGAEAVSLVREFTVSS